MCWFLLTLLEQKSSRKKKSTEKSEKKAQTANYSPTANILLINITQLLSLTNRETFLKPF